MAEKQVDTKRIKGTKYILNTVCTKTLYLYVDLGLLPIKNIDLPEKLSRNTKQHEVRENKKNLGRSIEDRPENVDLRGELGLWEIDSVLGKKNENEPAVVSLTERKLRNSIWLKVKNHSAEAVDEVLDKLIETFGDSAFAIRSDGEGGTTMQSASLFSSFPGKMNLCFMWKTVITESRRRTEQCSLINKL